MLRNGVAAASVFLLLKGRVRLSGITAEGEEVLLRWFLPQEFVGMASCLGEIPFPAEAIASGEVEAVQFDAQALRRHLATDAHGALALASIVSAFAAELVALFVSFTASRLDQRILGALERLAMHEPAQARGAGVKLMVSQQDIAHAVGASRQRVSVELRKLEKQGKITLGYRHIVVLRRLAPESALPA